MKIFFAALILFSSASFAAEKTVTEIKSIITTKPNLFEGNFEVGGGFTIANTKYENYDSENVFSIAPKVEYFLMDRFSLGGTFGYSSYSGSNSVSSTFIGPSATYYFHTADQLAFYGAQQINLTKYSGDSKTYTGGTTSVGTKFFFAPEAAFGVGFYYAYNLGNDKKYNNVGFNGSFSFYY